MSTSSTTPRSWSRTGLRNREFAILMRALYRRAGLLREFLSEPVPGTGWVTTSDWKLFCLGALDHLWRSGGPHWRWTCRACWRTVLTYRAKWHWHGDWEVEAVCTGCRVVYRMEGLGELPALKERVVEHWSWPEPIDFEASITLRVQTPSGPARCDFRKVRFYTAHTPDEIQWGPWIERLHATGSVELPLPDSPGLRRASTALDTDVMNLLDTRPGVDHA